LGVDTVGESDAVAERSSSRGVTISIDISQTAGSYLEKPFSITLATVLPFLNDVFDAIWTIDTLEHVPQPE